MIRLIEYELESNLVLSKPSLNSFSTELLTGDLSITCCIKTEQQANPDVALFTELAPRRRFERLTCRLGGGCSVQLSYRGEENLNKMCMLPVVLASRHSADSMDSISALCSDGINSARRS